MVQQAMTQTPVFLYLMQHEGAILLNMYLNMYLCSFNLPDLLLNSGCTAALLGFILRAGGGVKQIEMHTRQEEAEGEKEREKIN